MASPTSNKDNLDSVRDDILFDIYMYEKELSASNLRIEDIIAIKDKIVKAEELFKTIK